MTLLVQVKKETPYEGIHITADEAVYVFHSEV